MADYRDLAAALGGGYGQDTGGITPDTLAHVKKAARTASGNRFAWACFKAIGARDR
jgi:hypothetical protein